MKTVATFTALDVCSQVEEEQQTHQHLILCVSYSFEIWKIPRELSTREETSENSPPTVFVLVTVSGGGIFRTNEPQ